MLHAVVAMAAVQCQSSAHAISLRLRCCALVRSSGALACAAAEDWRAARARLLASEGFDVSVSGTSEYLFASPLIEQGSILLDARPDDDIADRDAAQTYFHKSCMLLLEHSDQMTVGLILNRPSAMQLDGWRLMFGGPVAEAGLFRGGDANIHAEPRQIICLHTLDSDIAAPYSIPVLPKVFYTSFQAATHLVELGAASRDDFTTYVGYAGWGPGQLQSEVDDGTWAIASTDRTTLLRDLLVRRSGLEQQVDSAQPQLSIDRSSARGSGGCPSSGIDTWQRLMRRIGRPDIVEASAASAADEQLTLWVQDHLSPPAPPTKAE